MAIQLYNNIDKQIMFRFAVGYCDIKELKVFFEK